MKKACENITQAQEMRKELLRQVDAGHINDNTVTQITFEKLAEYYKANYVTQPVYNLEKTKKLSGMRDRRTTLTRLTTLSNHFRDKLIRHITYSDIHNYKTTRLGCETQYKRPLSLASVHRELALLRRMLNVARQNKWIDSSPFNDGDALIQPGLEEKRQTILTDEQENEILKLCVGRRQHLKPILVCALDTGMRQGEIFKLQWQDVDLVNGVIKVQAFNTKTMHEKWLVLTERLKVELQKLWETSLQRPHDLVFGIRSNVKRAFKFVKSQVPELRFHDLRHTTGTRLAEVMPIAEVGRILGHTQVSTTYRYINQNLEMAKRAADILDKKNAK